MSLSGRIEFPGKSADEVLTVMATKAKRLDDDALRTRLSSKGVRVTEQRMILLRELAKHPQPVSHAELTEWIAGAGMDRATIYRNLVSLTEHGLLVRTQLGDSVWRYELPRGVLGEHGDHAHFVCTECGEIACLSKQDVSLSGAVAKNEITEVQLRGRCGLCRSDSVKLTSVSRSK
jgi:Fur family ferric uptake transcriptional regulator